MEQPKGPLCSRWAKPNISLRNGEEIGYNSREIPIKYFDEQDVLNSK